MYLHRGWSLNNRTIFIDVVHPWDHSVWTGATDNETEGTFKWNVGNGEEIYPPWYNMYPEQPDNYMNQDCLALMRIGNFSDDYCYSKLVFVCEKSQHC
jgi:hypothetical protein